LRVFVTGATGFIGSAVVQELTQAGHEVLGLARSDAAARSLIAAGAQVHRGDVQDLDSLRGGVAAADGVIHTAFIHDFSNLEAACETDRHAIEALGAALAGTDRPLIVTSGTVYVSPGRVATEDDTGTVTSDDIPRAATEEAARALAEQGVHVSVVRCSPSVHGDGDHAFVPILINIAREKGVSAYVDEGLNRWTAVHQLDAAHLYRLALEKASLGARYHAVHEEAIPFRDVAGVIGRRLNIPVVSISFEEAADHFGWLAVFAQTDSPASGKLTRERLGWQPHQPGLIPDLEHSARYFEAAPAAP
jgi:nucleoside-diphosphate-sugar epimerase